MRVLTPSGYRSADELVVGDELCAFDETGTPIINHVETVRRADLAEFREWQNPRFLINGSIEGCALEGLMVQEPLRSIPGLKQIRNISVGDWLLQDGGQTVETIEQVDEDEEYAWYRINGDKMLFREQSIWRNGTNVCHASNLVIGDTIYDDADNPIVITQIEKVVDESRDWYRFDVSGDHSYIVDGITVHNASRFWVSGTGSWDSSTTTHWGSASGTANNSSVPGSADTVTFDGSSGGGTVTLAFGGTITVQSITCGAFTGTITNATNNNNVTVTTSGSCFLGAGSGVRTLTLGSATYTLSNTISANWDFNTVTNLTLTAHTATISFTGAAAAKTFTGGTSKVWGGTVTCVASTGIGWFKILNSTTIAVLTVTAPNNLFFGASIAAVISTTINLAGLVDSAISVMSDTVGTAANVTLPASQTARGCVFRDMTFVTNALVASDSIDLAHNTLVTIKPPPIRLGSGIQGISEGLAR